MLSIIIAKLIRNSLLDSLNCDVLVFMDVYECVFPIKVCMRGTHLGLVLCLCRLQECFSCKHTRVRLIKKG